MVDTLPVSLLLQFLFKYTEYESFDAGEHKLLTVLSSLFHTGIFHDATPGILQLTVQPVAADVPGPLVVRPLSLHGVHSVASAALYEPVAHESHDVPFRYDPALHCQCAYNVIRGALFHAVFGNVTLVF
jgi:hypothetical protein